MRAYETCRPLPLIETQLTSIMPKVSYLNTQAFSSKKMRYAMKIRDRKFDHAKPPSFLEFAEMRPFQAVSFSIIILIFNTCSAAILGHSNDNTADKRSHRRHRKPSSPDGRIIAREEFNDGIHLELAPSCGANSWIVEINVGIEWHKMETVVSFGDSYSQVGNSGDGSPPAPLRFVGRNPSAGGRNTNGETWIGAKAAARLPKRF